MLKMKKIYDKVGYKVYDTKEILEPQVEDFETLNMLDDCQVGKIEALEKSRQTGELNHIWTDRRNLTLLGQLYQYPCLLDQEVRKI